MTEIQQEIDINVPLGTAYDQWTQFELFPEFMDHVVSVEQRGDQNVHFTASIAGVRREFDARIQEQRPDRLIRWDSTSGPENHGQLLFDPLTTDSTRLKLTVVWDPSDAVENMGSLFHLDELGIRQDLENFKRFIEGRGAESGAWRGDIEGGTVQDQPNPISGGDASLEQTTYPSDRTGSSPYGVGFASQDTRDADKTDRDEDPSTW